jgi:hypothetical protein
VLRRAKASIQLATWARNLNLDTNSTPSESWLARACRAICSIKLYQRQIYDYAYHGQSWILSVAARSTTSEPATRASRPSLIFWSIPTTYPHDLFRRDDDDLHDARSMSRAQIEMSAAEAKA